MEPTIRAHKTSYRQYIRKQFFFAGSILIAFFIIHPSFTMEVTSEHLLSRYLIRKIGTCLRDSNTDTIASLERTGRLISQALTTSNVGTETISEGD